MARIEEIAIDGIIVGSRARPLNEEGVESLMRSIEKMGLQTPITVRSDPGDYSNVFLVAGHHRLEACRRLGREFISCFVNEDADHDRAKMWELAENLHRAELTKLERSEHIAEWIKLADKVLLQVETKPQGGRPEGGIRAAARELGIDSTDAHRSQRVASLSDEAKEAAREAGLDDNQSVLLAASKSEDDVAFLRAEHARREAEKARKEVEALNRDTDAVIRMTAAEEFAEWLMEHSDLSQMPTLISWLEGTKPKEVISAMRMMAA